MPLVFCKIVKSLALGRQGTIFINNQTAIHRVMLALRQVGDYQSNTPGMCFSEPGCNINVSAAYDLQDAVTRLRVKAAFPLIEFHNFIFRAERKTLPELIANNGIHAGIILPKMDWQNSTKYLHKDAQLNLFINGLDVGATGLWPNGDGPEASVTWLRSNLESCGIELEAGNIVLAGTALGLYPVKNGDEVTVHFDEQPLVSCTIKDSCT